MRNIFLFFVCVIEKLMLDSCRLQENSDKSVIELQQYAKKNKPNLHILNKLREEMMKLARERVQLQIYDPFQTNLALQINGVG